MKSHRAQSKLVKQTMLTILCLFQSLIKEGLGYLVPLVIVLLVLATLLAVINIAAPIAPFVYSLF